MKKILKAFDHKKGYFVVTGTYFPETKVFKKRVLSSHYMRCKSGYGIQTTIMQKLLQLGCKTIQILAANCTYSISLKEWYDRGDIGNYGHGQQYFYPASFMKQVKK